MDRKTKLLAGIAVGAVAVLVATTAVQCTLRGGVAVDAGNSPSDIEDTASADAMAELYGTTWASDDGSWKLDFLDGVMIESGDGAGRTVFYDVQEATSDDGSVTATLRTAESQDAQKTESQLSVVKANGSMRLSCDALDHDYVSDAGDAKIDLVDATGDLESLLGKPSSDIAEGISSWASTRSPYATRATWSKEAWVDYGKGTKVTTFYLDDASSTIVSVTVSSDGKLVVS